VNSSESIGQGKPGVGARAFEQAGLQIPATRLNNFAFDFLQEPRPDAPAAVAGGNEQIQSEMRFVQSIGGGVSLHLSVLKNKLDALPVHAFNLLTGLPREAGKIHRGIHRVPKGKDLFVVGIVKCGYRHLHLTPAHCDMGQRNLLFL
jgi:hypothetical protein